MYQSYLLLRDNEQTGPYSLEQLLQLNLKPFDLVWEEGRSAAWRYPGEIASLQAYLSDAVSSQDNHPREIQNVQYNDVPSPRKVFVSMPGKRQVQQAVPVPPNEEVTDHDALIRQKAEELRLRVQSYAEQKQFGEVKPLIERPEPAYSYFQKSTSKKKITARQLITLCGISIAAMAGWYFYQNDDVPLPDAKPPATIISSTEPVAPLESGMETSTEALAVETIVAEKTSPRVAQVKKVEIKKPAVKNDNVPINDIAVIKEEAPPVVIDNKTPVPAVEPGNPAGEPAENKKEKKKLRDVVRNIFSPKDKEKADAAEEETPKPATGRKANKRAATDVDVSLDEVRDQIDISSNDKGNWMMGISGLKVTVRNRNNLGLESVIVVISYFDSNKKLLEKKELNFRNITANGKMILNAPDHRLADHTEISLGAVEIGKDSYVMDR